MTESRVRSGAGKVHATRPRNQFTIPVFPHVKKFILQKFNVSNPVKTEEYTTLGRIVTLVLKDERSPTSSNNSQNRDRVTESLTIVLTKDQARMRPSMYKLVRINQAMDDAFKEHLLTWVDAQQESGISAHLACRMFLEFYDIDHKEYTHDAAYKLWQRSRA